MFEEGTLLIFILWLLPTWIVVSWVLHLALRHRLPSGSSFRLFIGLGFYAVMRAGMQLMALCNLRGTCAIVGTVLFGLGIAGLLGWAASSGGSRFLYTPIGVVTKHWPGHMRAGADEVAGGSVWDRSSWRVASIVLALELIVVAVSQYYAGWSRIAGQ